jgi:hypothetical protein
VGFTDTRSDAGTDFSPSTPFFLSVYSAIASSHLYLTCNRRNVILTNDSAVK